VIVFYYGRIFLLYNSSTNSIFPKSFNLKTNYFSLTISYATISYATIPPKNADIGEIEHSEKDTALLNEDSSISILKLDSLSF
jgi:hypothetical protein